MNVWNFSQATWRSCCVKTILDAEIDADDSSDVWSPKNARPVALIHQRFDAAETRELEHLQDLATERLDAWDSQLLSDVAAILPIFRISRSCIHPPETSFHQA